MNDKTGTTQGNTRQQDPPTLGLLEWFRPGEHERVDQVLDDLNTLGVDHLRTGFSWADYRADGGEDWYAWLMPRLAEEVTVLPCFTYTPPDLGIKPKCSSPPRRPEDYAEFVDRMIDRFGDCFDWVELWNEPNNTNDWDWHLDPNWEIFSEMVHEAAHSARTRGKKTALAGMCPPDLNWLNLMGERGILNEMDAVGVHAFPGTWTFNWESWEETISGVRTVMERHDSSAEIWITEAGYSTWQHDEYRQLKKFVDALDAPADRLYWYSAHDLPPDASHQEGFHQDERHYHLGLRQANGRPKLLFRIWAEEGLEGVRELANLEKKESGFSVNGTDQTGTETPSVSTNDGQRPVFITGGAGFVGTNLAHRLLSEGTPVLIYDNLSRPGAERNLEWLIETHGPQLSWEVEDVRNPYALREAVQRAAQVYHFAGQAAVTTSIDRPEEDFQINTRGTLNVLEALRAVKNPPPLVFTSTNKVYGSLSDLDLREEETRYVPADDRVRTRGVGEAHSIDLRSPYGCSKGAADQYVLDYARTYDLPAVVFRMSCIYGEHQHGTEDQGWVAHFVRCIAENEPITLYGSGKQVRDILFIDDLVDALQLTRSHIDEMAGEAFNIGGGPANSVSLLELVDLASQLHGERPVIHNGEWRRGDQRYYVSDTSKLRDATGWSPQVGKREGISRLYAWTCDVLEQSPQRQIALV